MSIWTYRNGAYHGVVDGKLYSYVAPREREDHPRGEVSSNTVEKLRMMIEMGAIEPIDMTIEPWYRPTQDKSDDSKFVSAADKCMMAEDGAAEDSTARDGGRYVDAKDGNARDGGAKDGDSSKTWEKCTWVIESSTDTSATYIIEYNGKKYRYYDALQDIETRPFTKNRYDSEWDLKIKDIQFWIKQFTLWLPPSDIRAMGVIPYVGQTGIPHNYEVEDMYFSRGVDESASAFTTQSTAKKTTPLPPLPAKVIQNISYSIEEYGSGLKFVNELFKLQAVSDVECDPEIRNYLRVLPFLYGTCEKCRDTGKYIKPGDSYGSPTSTNITLATLVPCECAAASVDSVATNDEVSAVDSAATTEATISENGVKTAVKTVTADSNDACTNPELEMIIAFVEKKFGTKIRSVNSYQKAGELCAIISTL
jgi:hypothetical protein